MENKLHEGEMFQMEITSTLSEYVGVHRKFDGDI